MTKDSLAKYIRSLVYDYPNLRETRKQIFPIIIDRCAVKGHNKPCGTRGVKKMGNPRDIF